MQAMSIVRKNADTRLSPMAAKLKNGDVQFTGSFWGDFWFYIYNNHVLISIFCSHPENPNNKCARLLSFLASNVFAMFLAAVSTTQPEQTAFVLDYFVFLIVQTVFDMNASYVSSCKCFHREGVPACVRNVILPIAGALGGCTCLCCSGVAFLVMVIYYAVPSTPEDMETMGKVMRVYVLTKGISLIAAVLPLGLLSYSFSRRCHKELATATTEV